MEEEDHPTMRRFAALFSGLVVICSLRHHGCSDAFAPTVSFQLPRGVSLSMAKSSQLNDDNNASILFAMEGEAQELVLDFISTLNMERNHLIFDFFDDSIEFIDSSFHKPIIGKDALVRHAMEVGVLQVNGTFHSINVEGLATNVDSFCHDDVKVAVLYSTQDEEEGSLNGITFYTVCERKITNLFDVKECSGGVDVDWENVLASTTVVKGGMGNKSLQNTRVNDNGDGNVVSAFFQARNQRDLSAMMGAISDECSLNIAERMDNRHRVKGKALFDVEALLSLPDAVTFQIDEMITSSSPSDTSAGEVSVAVRWVIGVRGQRQRFSRGCSFFTVKNARITSIIDICESAKQEEFKSGLGISPSRLNWLRDYGGGRAIVDAMVYLSLPSLIKQNPRALASFAGLTRDRVHLQYGEHKSQFIDLFVPHDESKRRGFVFFVVSRLCV